MVAFDQAVLEGLDADKPAASAGTVGRLYFATDTGILYRDNGTAWVERANDLQLGTTATTAAAGNDSRLNDARTPTAHASSHATGDSDPLAPADIGAEPALGNPASDGYVLRSTAAGVRSWGAEMGGGRELAYAVVTTSTLSTTSTTLVDMTGASITATVGSRPVRVQFYSPGADTNSTIDPRVEFSIYDVTAGAEVGGCFVNGGSGGTTVVNLMARVNPASGSRTWKIQWRAVDLGTARVLATATRPVYLLVEEI